MFEPREDGPITFGCFNAFAKINAKLAEIWADLLKRVPESRLLLKSAGAGEASSRQRIIGQFAEHGVAGERIEMLGRIADPRRHLELYRRVDVALDTYPYHGTTTTCEALWMGVPVVSLAGRIACFARWRQPAELRGFARTDRTIRGRICVDRLEVGCGSNPAVDVSGRPSRAGNIFAARRWTAICNGGRSRVPGNVASIGARMAEAQISK